MTSPSSSKTASKSASKSKSKSLAPAPVPAPKSESAPPNTSSTESDSYTDLNLITDELVIAALLEASTDELVSAVLREAECELVTEVTDELVSVVLLEAATEELVSAVLLEAERELAVESLPPASFDSTKLVEYTKELPEERNRKLLEEPLLIPIAFAIKMSASVPQSVRDANAGGSANASSKKAEYKKAAKKNTRNGHGNASNSQERRDRERAPHIPAADLPPGVASGRNPFVDDLYQQEKALDNARHNELYLDTWVAGDSTLRVAPGLKTVSSVEDPSAYFREAAEHFREAAEQQLARNGRVNNIGKDSWDKQVQRIEHGTNGKSSSKTNDVPPRPPASTPTTPGTLRQPANTPKTPVTTVLTATVPRSKSNSRI